MERITRFSALRVREAKLSFIRYLYDQIDWNERLIGILGARGTGKTTLLLQRIKNQHPDPDIALYLSLDDPWFQEHDLLDSIEDFVNRGGKFIYLDEVHKYKGWSASIKTMYDTFHELNIVFTGSSILEIQKGDADLSRRVIQYRLEGLSFREYLNFTEKLQLPVYSFEELTRDHVNISLDIVQQTKILKAFRDYLIRGYYPFFLEKGDNYHIKLAATITQVLETDLAPIENLKIESLNKLKRFLTVVAEMVPFQPNITELSDRILISRPMIYKFLDYLNRSSVINMVDKIYLHNTNLSYSLAGGEPDKGTLRETFFINQVQPRCEVTYGNPFDFLIDGRYAVEIGGKNKNSKQLRNQEKAILAIDDIETGYQNKVPLWLFGFLY